MERWEWAHSRNLKPPIHVKTLIDSNANDKDYTER